VRFVNQGEYDAMIRRGMFDPREAFVVSGKSFRDWLENACKHWRDTIYQQTEWDHSSNSLYGYNYLIGQLRKAHKAAKQSGTKNIRERTVQILKQVLQSEAQKPVEFTGPGEPLGPLKAASLYESSMQALRSGVDFMPMLQRTDAENLAINIERLARKNPSDSCYTDREAQRLGKLGKKYVDCREIRLLAENLLDCTDPVQREWFFRRVDYCYDQWRKILDTPESALQSISAFLADSSAQASREELRKVFHDMVHTSWENEGRVPYHMALVFGQEAISESESYGKSHWRYLEDQGTHQQPPEEFLLGAIAIMPNKEIWQEMIAKSQHAGPLAHVVFDCKGNVRFPSITSVV